MASFIFYFFLAIVGPLIAGVVMAFLYFFGFDMIRRKVHKIEFKRFKKMSPDDRAKHYGDPGKPIITQKEVEENDRKQFAKFREFEKLRDAELNRSRERGDAKATGTVPEYKPLSRYRIQSDDDSIRTTEHFRELGETISDVGEDEQGIDLPKPTSLRDY